jgi:hypothetical protein
LTTQPTTTTTVDPVDAMADATSCPELAALVIDGLQINIDAYATIAPQQVAQLSTELRPDLERLATTSGQTAADLGCGGQEYLDLLGSELEQLQPGTGVQRAVAGTFISGLLGGDDPSDPGASTIEVTTAAELDAASRVAGTGSTIELAAGDYAIAAPLVLLRGVTVIGAGADTTTITSTAPGAGVLVATRGTVTLQGLTVINDAPSASVVAITRGGLTLQDATVAGGRRDADGNGGYGLILAPDTTLEVGTHTVTDTTFNDNDGGGILIDGPISPTLSGLEVNATTGCAVCWIGESSGTLEGATITGGDVGVRAEDTASPTISEVSATDAAVGAVVLGTSTPSMSDVSFIGGSVGIAVDGDAAPELVRVSLTDNTDIALRLGGTSTATVTDVAVTGDTGAGIGILDDAAPTITGGTIEITGDVGVLSSDTSTGTINGLTVREAGIGIQITSDAAPAITGGSIEITGEVGVLFSDTAGGTIDGLTVRGARIGIQISDEAAPTLSGIVATALGEAAALVLERGAGTIESMQCDQDDSGVIGLQTEGDITIADDIGCRVVEAS